MKSARLLELLINEAEKNNSAIIKLGPYKFGIRGDGGRVDFVFSHSLDFTLNEAGAVQQKSGYKLERCVYDGLEYPKHQLREIDVAEVERAMQKIAQIVQEKAAEIRACNDANIFLAVKENSANVKKSSFQNQDFVAGAAVEDGYDSRQLLQELVIAAHEKYNELTSSNQAFYDAGASCVYAVVDSSAEARKVDVANLGDGVALVCGFLADGKPALIRLAKPMSGKDQKFRDMVTANLRDQGYLTLENEGNLYFVENEEDPAADFVISAKGRLICGERSLAMLGVVGDQNFDLALIRQPDLQSFSEAEIPGFKMEFVFVASDGFEPFLKNAIDKFVMFERDKGGQLVILNKDQFKAQKVLPEPFKGMFDRAKLDLEDKDDLSMAGCDTRDKAPRARRCIGAFDGHGALGGFVAQGCAQSFLANRHLITRAQAVQPDIFAQDFNEEDVLRRIFVKNVLKALKSFKQNFPSLDMSDFPSRVQLNINEVVGNVLQKRAELGSKIYDVCCYIFTTMKDNVGFGRGCDSFHLGASQDNLLLEFDLFLQSHPNFTINRGGFFQDGERLDLSKMSEVFDTLKSRFIERIMEKIGNDFDRQKFGEKALLIPCNEDSIILDDKRCVIVYDSIKNNYRLAKVSQEANGVIKTVAFVVDEKFEDVATAFFELISKFEERKSGAKKRARQESDNDASGDGAASPSNPVAKAGAEPFLGAAQGQNITT